MREFQSSPEYQLQREIINELTKPTPTVVAIEGGPCSGKTTLIQRLEAAAGERTIVFLPEAATAHIERLQAKGVDIARLPSDDRPAWLRLERDILRTIVNNIEQARETYRGTDTIIVTDRCDIGAYVTKDEHAELLDELSLAMPPMLSHVDKLYFLPSLARIDPDHYESVRRSNPTRVEDAPLAQTICARNLDSVARHPELHIAWGGDFDSTMRTLADIVLHPELESEIKLEPEPGSRLMPDFLASSYEVNRAVITQTYYELDGLVFRLRKIMTTEGEVLRYFTVKHGEGVQRREIQRQIDEQTYSLLSTCQQVGESLVKERLVVLRDEDGTKKRAWACDRYFDRRLPEWNIETDVAGEFEAELLNVAMHEFVPARLGAEKLARKLGAYTLRPVLS